MESTSEAGRIHCSRTSAELLQVQMPSISVHARGRIAVKGKGEIDTFWVSNNNDEQQRQGMMMMGEDGDWSGKYFGRVSRQHAVNEASTSTTVRDIDAELGTIAAEEDLAVI